LAVAQQTVREGEKFGIAVNYCRAQEQVQHGITIANYEMLEHFDAAKFAGVVLDESSIIKNYTGKFRNLIISSFAATPFRLACTATPAPNDVTEIANHVEFLGIKSRHELLSEFFVHDGGQTSIWRLKRHAVKLFWEFVAGWAVMMQLPSDLGYEDNGFKLPPINIHQIVVDKTGYIVKEALTLQDRRGARRDSLSMRVSKAAEIVNASDESWIVWCDLNVESEALKKAIPGAVEVKGSDDPDYKAKSLIEFAKGNIRILVTKSSIAGFGLNLQVCHNQVFVGISDSFEGYYQAVRRSWRFGQKYPVNVFVITSEKEGAVVKNIQRKERDFDKMLRGMISQTQELTKRNLKQTTHSTDEYNPMVEMTIPDWCKSFA
jgi:SNF2 family DNA or RNA helicase